MRTISTYREPIITNNGLMKHLGEKDFGALIIGKGKKAQFGELISYGSTNEIYAIITEEGGKIILIPGKTKVVISPSQRAIKAGRTARRIYEYVKPSETQSL